MVSADGNRPPRPLPARTAPANEPVTAPAPRRGPAKVGLLLAAMALAATAPPGPAQSRPATTSKPAGVKPSTAANVQAAVAKAVQYLYSQIDNQGAIANRHSSEYVGGGEALAALALLRAGESPDDPRLRRMLEYLRGRPPGHTYTRSLRAIVFAMLPDEADYRKRLAEDAQWLLDVKTGQLRTGGWGYGPASAMTRLRPDWTDASNSQLALLALREAADAGAPVPAEAWRLAEAYWRKLQNEDGGWGYQPKIGGQDPQRPESHGSMTAAGVATYFILAERLGALTEGQDSPERGRFGRTTGAASFGPQLERGLTWLADNYAVDQVPKYVWTAQPGQLYYYLFLLQRVTDATGVRTIGRNDCAARTVGLVLGQQQPGGAWGDSIIDTSFALLSLLQADAPVVVTRLQFGKDPGKDARDAANVAGWLRRNIRRSVTWQKLPADSLEACESRLLYLSSPPEVELPKGLPEKLVAFVRNGGTLLVQAPTEDMSFSLSFQEQCLKLFPDYRRQEIRPEHPIWSVRFPVEQDHRPKLTGIGDGCRTRIFILQEDLAGSWHQGSTSVHSYFFQLAGNLCLYAAGGELPGGRVSSAVAGPAPPPARRFINVARLKYDGDFDACPLTVSRLSDALSFSLSIGLKELPPVDPSRNIDADAPLLYLTGNSPPSFSDEQLKNLRDYLQRGGTLLIDPATGRGGFRAAGEQLASLLVGEGGVQPLPPDSPLIKGDFAGGVGADLSAVRLLPRATTQPVQPAPARLLVGLVRDRPAVILSQYGLACSIEGTPCLENVGYVPADARKIALNVILYAALGR